MTFKSPPPAHTSSEEFHLSMSMITADNEVGDTAAEADVTFYFNGRDVVGAILNGWQLDARTASAIHNALTRHAPD
jgi:hypothetical protein